MVVQKHARNILFYDVMVSRRTEQAPYPKLHDIAPLWLDAQKDPAFPPKEFERGMVTSIIKDAALDQVQQILTLLIEVSDKNAPNTTYLDHAKRLGRHIKKDDPEGNGHASHVVVSLKEEAGKPNTYLAMIEQIPSVSINRIQSTLNTAIRHLCKNAKGGLFTFVKPGGGKKAQPYVPHIVLGGHPSDQFKKDIEEGRINGLQLIAPSANAPLGQSKYLTIDEYSVKVKVSKNIPKGQRWKTLAEGVRLKKDDFPSARIYIQPEHEGPSFHVDIDADTGNIISQAYVKSKRLSGFAQMLDTSSPDAIVPHFEAIMKNILVKERT